MSNAKIKNLTFSNSFDGKFKVAYCWYNKLYINASNESGEWKIIANEKYLNKAEIEQILKALKFRAIEGE